MRRALVVLSLIALTGIGCGPNKKKLAQSSSLYQLGTQKLTDGNAEGAVADLSQAARMNPKNPEIEHALGLAFWSKAKVANDDALKAEAEKHMKRSFELMGKERIPGDWFNNLGALYVDMRRWPDAVVQLEKAKSDPEYRTPERPLNNLAYASNEQGKWTEALTYSESALRYQPKFCMGRIQRGRAYEGMKKLADAYEDYLFVTTECPEYAEAWYRAGMLAFKLGKKTDAQRMFLKTLDMDPEGEWGREARKALRGMGINK